MMQGIQNEKHEFKDRVVDAPDAELPDAGLEDALKDFKRCIDAWSEATYLRPRAVTSAARLTHWRLAAGWALGCALVAGSVGGGLMERRHRQELARIATEQRAAEQARQLQQQQSRAKITDEVLLAGVDSDVSRQVPSAMEPLAQLMGDDETK